MSRKLLSGNEAIARGAWEAGCQAGFGYPGTPSTETLESFSKLPDVYAEWCVNEKVALETALGFVMNGRRALVTMKHVGVNVAADPLMSIAMTGTKGGFVLLAADDPGMFSSQNEQDSRFWASFARVPMFEPADSSEALAMTKEAFEVSERFGTLAMVRSTVRISHTRTIVEEGERCELPKTSAFEHDPSHWVMMPLYARRRRLDADERVKAMTDYVEACPFNRAEIRDAKVGFVASGAAYQHVREAFPEASTYKLGISYPLPAKGLAKFFDDVEKVYVVDEACTYFLDAIRAMGLEPAEWPCGLPGAYELSPALIRAAMGAQVERNESAYDIAGQCQLPGRPPALCAGCPHRIPFFELKRMKAIALGDIGCYTLGALPPLEQLDSAVDMGASIGMGHGMELSRAFDAADGSQADARPVWSVIGDSTFAHSGLSGVLSRIYNGGVGNVLILDNRTTAMTGGQGNAVNGISLQGRPSHEVDLPALLKASGVEDCVTVDALDLTQVRSALKDAVSHADKLSVVIAQSPCVVEYKVRGTVHHVDVESCRGCRMCVRIGCPAISFEDGRARIDAAMCNGCSQCAQYCAFNAISKIGE